MYIYIYIFFNKKCCVVGYVIPSVGCSHLSCCPLENPNNHSLGKIEVYLF